MGREERRKIRSKQFRHNRDKTGGNEFESTRQRDHRLWMPVL